MHKTEANNVVTPNADYIGGYGLTKREEFAKTAMQGLVTVFFSKENAAAVRQASTQHGMKDKDYIATVAVEMADALIEVLNKKQ